MYAVSSMAFYVVPQCHASQVCCSTTVLCSINNQHNAQICTTALFYMLAPTCFGSSLPSSRELLDPSELRENIDRYGGLSKIYNR
jgi:hypothetical protein